MVFSENIYFLILFTLPAAINIIYNNHIKQVPILKEDKSVELAESVIFCLAVLGINLLFMRKGMFIVGKLMLLSEEARSKYIEATNFNYFEFMITYFGVNIIDSIGVIILWHFGRKILRLIINKINTRKNRPNELEYGDVWSNLFEDNKIVNVRNTVLKIERSGTMITAGLLKTFSPPNKKNREFVLYNTDLIKEIFRDDEKIEYDLRTFKCAEYEYYDTENDMLIKFYSTEIYDKVNH